MRLADMALQSQLAGPAPQEDGRVGHGAAAPALPEEVEPLAQGELGHVAVLRPRLSQRKGVYWITCRMWYAPAKLQGIGMLKHAKDTMDEKALSLISADLIQVASLVFPAFDGVVSAPSPRHSAFKGVPHFATELARRLAEATGNTHEALFEVMGADRLGHHPAREKEPPKVRPEKLPREPRVLLVDDVATSGQTMELHARALQEHGAKVMGLVWCFGQTTGSGK